MIKCLCVSLYKRGEVWWSRIEVNKRVYQFSCKTGNRNTARTFEAQERTRLLKHTTGLACPTLNEFAKDFINSLFGGRVAKETRRFYSTHWQSLIWNPARGEFESPLCNLPLDKIGPGEIETWVQWRRKQNVSPTTINHSLRTLRRALHLAAEWNVISKVPKVRLLGGEVQREYVIREDAVEKFAKEPGLIAKLVPFLVDTGLRRREVCELKWEDVNSRTIFVKRSKSKYGRRHIPLTDRAAEILKNLPRDGETVFGIKKDRISHLFLDARKRLSLPAECVLHSTRHTFCTRLGEAGADAFAIQRLAGHSSITISQRYVRPTAARLDGVIALLNGKK